MNGANETALSVCMVSVAWRMCRGAGETKADCVEIFVIFVKAYVIEYGKKLACGNLLLTKHDVQYY